jgi:hypothetical protein
VVWIVGLLLVVRTMLTQCAVHARSSTDSLTGVDVPDVPPFVGVELRARFF